MNPKPCHANTPRLTIMLQPYAGARTAWSCTVTVGDFPPTPARYWYSGHYNAYEDAAEVMLKIILDYVDKYGCTWEKVRRPSLQTAGPPISCVARVSTFSPGNYANYTHNYTHSSPPQGGGHGYGTIGTGIGPGTCNTYSQSQSHSPVNVARGKPYVSSSFGG